MRKPIEFSGFPPSLQEIAPYGTPTRAVIKYDVDGDTIYCLLSPGFDEYPFIVIRLARINAPELFSGTVENKVKGKEAKDYIVSLIPEGTQVVITAKPSKDIYGRYVAEIILSDGRNVSDEMLAAGFAVPYKG